MSWLLNLYNTYEANREFIGKIETKHNGQEFTLLPVSHTTQNAHVEVTVSPDGEFLTAKVIEDKADMSTLIPCTESSASRAGAVIAPYPLHDKLSYVAGDYVAYGGEVKKELPFAAYIKQLGQWAESVHAHPKVKSIYAYLSQGRLIQDLVKARVLCIGPDNKLADKWDKHLEALYEAKPKIFSVIPGDQFSVFVRFDVYDPMKKSVKVWRDPEVYDSFVRYYAEQLGDTDICYVKGERLPASDRHANKIRHAADKAKLISANDTSGFTFRGRFSSSNQAASISYEVSQKAHNALKWLINRQAKQIDGRVFLVWGERSLDIPAPEDDPYEAGFLSDEALASIPETRKEIAEELSRAIDSYRNRLETIANDSSIQINILMMDSATTGRMGILYYRSLNHELYFDKLLEWHSTCVWLHRYRKIMFVGAPSTRDIAFAAFGPRADDKIVKGLMERMLPCIVDGRPIPRDIVDNAFRRASNPVAMEMWEWEKTLSIACALINKKYQKEELGVALDRDNDNRDYLFGRLLALADILERRALGREEKRATNAIRYMNAFTRHPLRTWKTIQSCIQPYQAKLGNRVTDLNRQIDEVISKFSAEDFNDQPLSGLYLLGFSSQRHDYYNSFNTKQDEDQESDEG